MPFYQPLVRISTSTPIKVGGTPTAGTSKLASANDHVHGLTETSGPTNLSVASIRDLEVFYRNSGNVPGKRYQAWRLGALVSTTSTSLQTFATIAIARAGTYTFGWVGAHSSSPTVGFQAAFNFTGTTSGANFMNLFRVTAGNAMGLNNTSSFNSKLGSAGGGSDGNDWLFYAWGHIAATGAGNLTLLYCSGVGGSIVAINAGAQYWLHEEV